MSFIGIVYALHVKDNGQHMAAFLYIGGSLGVTFAGDYFTLFVFWELMAFASAYLVFAKREKRPLKPDTGIFWSIFSAGSVYWAALFSTMSAPNRLPSAP